MTRGVLEKIQAEKGGGEIVQVVIRRHFTVEDRVRSQESAFQICFRQSGNGRSFSPSTSVFPCQYYSTIPPYSSIHLPPTLYNVFLPALQFYPVSTIPPLLHTHSSIYHPHYIMFLFQQFCLPSQYHSTIAPYSSPCTVAVTSTDGRSL